MTGSSIARQAVFHGIVHCFLSDAEQVVLNQWRQRPERAIDFDLGLNSSLIRQTPRRMGQRRRQIIVVESRRSQVPNVTACLGDTMTNLLSRAVQMVPGS